MRPKWAFSGAIGATVSKKRRILYSSRAARVPFSVTLFLEPLCRYRGNEPNGEEETDETG